MMPFGYEPTRLYEGEDEDKEEEGEREPWYWTWLVYFPWWHLFNVKAFVEGSRVPLMVKSICIFRQMENPFPTIFFKRRTIGGGELERVC